MRSLLQHFPEWHCESDLQYQATLLGLWLLATVARRPGLPAFGGYNPTDLASLLRPRLLAVFDFLAEYGALPGLLQTVPVITAVPEVLGLVEPAVQSLDAEAAVGLTDLGSDFLD